MTLPTPLINRVRAEAVMQGFGVAALVLADPINIYQATGLWPQTVVMGQLGTALAVVPADSAQPVTLIMGQFVHYLFDVDALPPGGPLRLLLTTSADEDGAAAPPTFFRPASDGVPDRFDRATRDETLDHLSSQPAYPTSFSALRAALSMVATGSTLAVDGHVAEAVVGGAFPLRPADPLLRRIRMIKSAAEIDLLRHAARQNEAAVRAALASVSVGDSYAGLRRAFFAETGKRGGIPSFLMTDSVAYRERDGVIRDGRAFQVDAVASYAGYHGDYGRTVFVGTPQPALRRAMDAAIAANVAIARALRPGLHYSDIVRIGRAAIADAGFDVLTPSSPHSVGLFHTDEAFKDDSPFMAKADHLIEKDMVLSVDCPILQTDIGGTVHLEDMWLITADGCEPLNDTADPFIQL